MTVNATQMAKPFGKLVGGWLRLESTKEFLNALSADMRIHTSALIQTVKGGNGEQGTWMHEDVALEFARWLSPKFAIWCNRRIKELLTATKEPKETKVLPPPIENQQVTAPLIEYVDGKPVTTSRILARVLGRKHDRILETIRNNSHRRAFKYGHFTMRPYSCGSSHGYEFLITRKGLEALASMMRYNAKERIAGAYAGAWSVGTKLLPAPVPPLSPVENQEDDPVDELTDAPDTIRELAQWIGELRADLRKARETAKMYIEMYENEKRRRQRNDDAMAHRPDLYQDLLWRLLHDTDTPLDDRLAAHLAFRERIKVK